MSPSVVPISSTARNTRNEVSNSVARGNMLFGEDWKNPSGWISISSRLCWALRGGSSPCVVFGAFRFVMVMMVNVIDWRWEIVPSTRTFKFANDWSDRESHFYVNKHIITTKSNQTPSKKYGAILLPYQLITSQCFPILLIMDPAASFTRLFNTSSGIPFFNKSLKVQPSLNFS